MDLVELVQNRVASTSVGASTARGMGPKGTVAAARKLLRREDLNAFSVDSESQFRAQLNRATRRIQKGLPTGAQHWGAARKFLNIYLRGAMYNKYLCEAYNLDHIDYWLEIPMDSHVARGLRNEAGGREATPPWKSVIALDARTNTKYQQFAQVVGERYGLARVHLDALYWRRTKDD